jgi:2-polyprenyl-3-methyl-5-hydroxy-6-metoxy-1,4-benzoquinol methylase
MRWGTSSPLSGQRRAWLVANKPTHTHIDLDVNYRYFVSYGVARRERRSVSVLEFGCGDGVLVRALRRQGIDCSRAPLSSARLYGR